MTITDTTPTLKMRLDVSGMGPLVGTDCHSVAQGKIIGARLDVDLLDVKWGRPADKWRETGRGWGRTPLDAFDRGYIAALKNSATSDPVITELLRIIDRVAS